MPNTVLCSNFTKERRIWTCMDIFCI